MTGAYLVPADNFPTATVNANVNDDVAIFTANLPGPVRFVVEAGVSGIIHPPLDISQTIQTAGTGAVDLSATFSIVDPLYAVTANAVATINTAGVLNIDIGSATSTSLKVLVRNAAGDEETLPVNLTVVAPDAPVSALLHKSSSGFIL